MRYNNMLRNCGVSIAALAIAAASSPANSAPTGAKVDGSDTGLTDIVVTARRRSESAQTVPVAVSVATAATLEQHQVENAYGLVNLTPSLQVTTTPVGGNAAINFAIRGIGTSIFGPQVESSVGVVIDDVAMGRPEFGGVQFFDLDRIEVLRGPQGMLFGKNASAGVINVTTASPVLGRTEFMANVTYGNTTAPTSGNMAKLEVVGNTPISSNAALRVAAFVTHEDSFAKNLTRPQGLGFTAEGVRAKFLWTPTDTVRLTLAGDYQHTDGPGAGVLVHRFSAPGGLVDTIDRSNGIIASPKNTRTATDQAQRSRSDLYGGSLKAEIDLGGHTLTNVVAHGEWRFNTSVDQDTTTGDLYNQNDNQTRFHQTTEELRLSSPNSYRLSYQLGLYFMDLYANTADQQSGNLGIPFPPGVSALGATFDIVSKTKSYAGFFEGQFKVTDNLRITAGARYTHDVIGLDTIFSPGTGLFSLVGPTRRQVSKTTENNFSYRVGVDYDLAPDVLAYFTHARGYKGPTFDLISGSLVNPEIPTSYELGLKATVLDRRLRMNVALFDTTFKGFQTQAQTAGGTFLTLNAGSLKTRGVEVEFTALPFPGLTLSGGTTYNFTEYRNLRGIPCYYGQPTGTSGTNVCLPTSPQLTTDVSGNQLANAPRWTTSFTARYEHELSPRWVGFLQGDVYDRSSFSFTQTRDPQMRLNPGAVFGLSAGARTADDKLSITAFVRNLTDKRIPTYILADPLGAVFVGPLGVPDAALGGNYWHSLGSTSFRTVGVSLNYRM